MKKWVSLTALLLVAGFAFLSVGCEPPDEDPVTNLNFEIVNDTEGNPGGGIKVTWSAPATATPDEYIVSVDGADQVAVDVTEDYVYTAGAEVAVYAVYNDVKSAAETLDFKVIVTDIDVYTTDDPAADHPSGFGFTPAGSAQTYSVSTANQDEWPDIDYYISSGHVLTAPMDHLPDPLNAKGSAASVETDAFDDLDIVAAPGNYLTQRDLTVNGIYGLWLDAANDNYDVTDHFGKAFVEGISGEQVTLKVAYQTVAGLRWVVTD